jgi:hypothetical protein
MRIIINAGATLYLSEFMLQPMLRVNSVCSADMDSISYEQAMAPKSMKVVQLLVALVTFYLVLEADGSFLAAKGSCMFSIKREEG